MFGRCSLGALALVLSAAILAPGGMARAAGPLVGGPVLTGAGRTTMTVSWIRSTESGACTLSYGVGTLDHSLSVSPSQTFAGTPNEYLYEAPLSGLTPGSAYSYQIDCGGTMTTGTFRTFADAPAETRFVFVSDSHEQAGTLGGLAARFVTHNPDFVIHGGDMTDAGNTYSKWRPGFFTPLAGALDRTPLATSHGNHEEDGTGYYRVFSLSGNERWYSFDHGDVHVVVLNSNLYRHTALQPLIPEMLAWCQADLAASSAKWKVVVHHQPCYDLGRRGDTDQLMRVDSLKGLLPIYRAGGVDLALSGHSHVYARYKPIYKDEADRSHPITQIIGSGGGGGLSAAHLATPHLAAGASAFHYLFFTATASQLTGQAIKADGTVLDSFTVTKNAEGQYDAAWLAAAQPEGTFGRVIINTQPATVTVDPGLTATFTVGAVGAQNSNSALYFQWRKNGVDISGATGSSYTAPAAALADHGTRYSVAVWNYFNSVASQDAVLRVTGGNLAPVADAQSVSTDQDEPKAITLTGSDDDGDDLTFLVETDPSHGVLSGAGADRTYTPAAGYHGTDSFTFKVNDGHADSASATVSITIDQVNVLPVAVTGVLGGVSTVPAGTLVTLSGSGSYDPDAFPGGGALTYSWTKISGPATTLSPADAVHPSFTPATVGTYVFKLVVNDSAADSTDASSPDNTVTVTVTAAVDPLIGLSAVTLHPTCDAGSNATVQTFKVWNSGGGTLDYTVNSGATTWLSVSPTSGDSTGIGDQDTITVSYATSGLSAGSYPATITVSAPGLAGQAVAVTLVVATPNGSGGGGGGGGGCSIVNGPKPTEYVLGWAIPYLTLGGICCVRRLRRRRSEASSIT